jgi:hypothetical protein
MSRGLGDVYKRQFLALAFSCTGAYKVCKSNGPLFAVMTD